MKQNIFDSSHVDWNLKLRIQVTEPTDNNRFDSYLK